MMYKTAIGEKYPLQMFRSGLMKYFKSGCTKLDYLSELPEDNTRTKSKCQFSCPTSQLRES